MVGIALTVLAVLLVIVLAFCYSDHGKHSRNAPRELPFLDKAPKKRS